MAEKVIKFSVDCSDVTRKLRIIAKHAAALADELDGVEQKAEPEPAAETAPQRQELSCTSASTERRWSPGQEAPASAFGFGGRP